jgi:abequosyltransferase
MIVNESVLTIAIPTWNRAHFLVKALREIQQQRAELPEGSIELLICDNHSTDETLAVIEAARALGSEIRHVRHSENLGSDRNIAACFDLATSPFVQILGDDDMPVPGFLARLLDLLQDRSIGLIYLRPYGFRKDAIAERPKIGIARAPVKTTLAPFMSRVGAHITFISSIVFNKSLTPDLCAERFCGTLLVQVDIGLSIALKSQTFAYFEDFCIAAQSNNSGGYDVTDTFAHTLGRLVAKHEAFGLDPQAGKSLWVAMLMRYFPQYCLTHRLVGSQGVEKVIQSLDTHFIGFRAYRLLVRPILWLPRPLGIAWGAGSSFVGRLLGGDGDRIWAYVCSAFVAMAGSKPTDKGSTT